MLGSAPSNQHDWKYASIDIETLGLSPECDIIEFGCVLDDLVSPISKLPTFHTYVVVPEEWGGRYKGEPYAMSMHKDILMRIAKRTDGYTYTEQLLLEESFRNWLNYVGYEGKVVVAGKNFQSFDMKFLQKQCRFGEKIKFHHRGLDPASMFYDPKIDREPPSLEACLKRAGIEKSVEHTAVADAIDVIRCIRYKYGINNEV